MIDRHPDRRPHPRRALKLDIEPARRVGDRVEPLEGGELRSFGDAHVWGDARLAALGLELLPALAGAAEVYVDGEDLERLAAELATLAARADEVPDPAEPKSTLARAGAWLLGTPSPADLATRRAAHVEHLRSLAESGLAAITAARAAGVGVFIDGD